MDTERHDLNHLISNAGASPAKRLFALSVLWISRCSDILDKQPWPLPGHPGGQIDTYTQTANELLQALDEIYPGWRQEMEHRPPYLFVADFIANTIEESDEDGIS